MRIVLFDIPRKDGSSFSPNTFRTRFALQYKGIPFETEWIEFPDIEPRLKACGALANDPSLTPIPYTVPALAIYETDHDGNEELKEVIMESNRIAVFLDQKYQSRQLFRGSPASQEAQRVFISLISAVLHPVLVPLLVPSAVNQLSPRSAEYYRRTREIKFGCKLEELVASTDIVQRRWKIMEVALDQLAIYLDRSVAEGKTLLEAAETDGTGGQTTKMEPTYAALVLVAAFVSIEEAAFAGTWEHIRMRNDGKWNSIRTLCASYTY